MFVRLYCGCVGVRLDKKNFIIREVGIHAMHEAEAEVPFDWMTSQEIDRFLEEVRENLKLANGVKNLVNNFNSEN